MKKAIALSLVFASPLTLLGVYAPVPTQEQGKKLIIELEGGIFYDDNIFGTDGKILSEQESWVFEISPKIKVNTPLSDRTFFSGWYDLTARYFDDRPVEDDLYNHEIGARIAHSFSESVSLDVSNTFFAIENPESTLKGGGPYTDQSYDENVFRARLNADLSERFGTVVKYRNRMLGYDHALWSSLLDRDENLFGVEGLFYLQPDLALVGEIRYQDIAYDTLGSIKDNDSFFYLAGVDYNISQVTEVSARLGVEDRDRSASGGDTSFYGQLLGLHRYAEQSYFSGGVTWETQETDFISTYSDEESVTFFMNVQHALTPTLFAGGSLLYEDSTLQQARAAGISDIDEDTLRFGMNLTFQPTINWAVILSYDYDEIDSDDPLRNEDRSRIGVRFRYTFGQ